MQAGNDRLSIIYDCFPELSSVIRICGRLLSLFIVPVNSVDTHKVELLLSIHSEGISWFSSNRVLFKALLIPFPTSSLSVFLSVSGLDKF